MYRPVTHAEVARASRQLLTLLGSIGILLLLFVGWSAFGQTVDIPTVPVESTGKTLLGYIFIGILSLVALGIGWLVVRITVFVNAKTKDTTLSGASAFGWGLVNKAWMMTTNIGARLFARERDLIEKILSDGTVTPEEWKQLKDKIAIDIQVELKQELPMLAQFLGGSGALTSLIEGFAAKVTNGLLTQGKVPLALPAGEMPVVVPPPAPAPSAPPAGEAVPS